MLLCLKQRKKVFLRARTHSHVRQSHKITQADQDDLPVGVLMKDAWWDTSWESECLCHKSKTSKSHTKRRKHTKDILLLLEITFLLKRKKIMSFDFSKRWKKISSRSCRAWLKVGHLMFAVIDVTGATSTIRGELVDVCQCHRAQWNTHQSA